METEKQMDKQPRMEVFSEKKLIGKRIEMSFADNKTKALWQSFMPRRKEITNKVGTDLYSLEVYPPQFFDRFNTEAAFDKWAAIEVTDFDTVPHEMETLVVPEGLYAVFVHYGPGSEAAKTYEYIFRTWLPNADFLLDHRPHFAIIGEKYKHEDPASEEEVWIPVRPK